MLGQIIKIKTREDRGTVAIGPHPDEIAAPGNIRDPNKIKEREKENFVKWCERLPLDWRTAEIAVAGILAQTDDGDRASLLIVEPDQARYFEGLGELDLPASLDVVLHHVKDERELLLNFWELLGKAQWEPGPDTGRFVAGFGIREFDLPVLMLRSVLLGVAPQMRLSQLAKYRDWTLTGVLDLQDYLGAWDRFPMTGWPLIKYADLFRLASRPHGAGVDFPERFGEGDFQWCLKHTAHDLIVAGELLQHVGVMLA